MSVIKEHRYTPPGNYLLVVNIVHGAEDTREHLYSHSYDMHSMTENFSFKTFTPQVLQSSIIWLFSNDLYLLTEIHDLRSFSLFSQNFLHVMRSVHRSIVLYGKIPAEIAKCSATSLGKN